MKIKTRLVLAMDWLTQPITQYLAFESQLKDMEALIPPKSQAFILEVRRLAKCLPKHLRGAFLYNVEREINLGKQSKDVRLTQTFKRFIKDHNLKNIDAWAVITERKSCQ